MRLWTDSGQAGLHPGSPALPGAEEQRASSGHHNALRDGGGADKVWASLAASRIFWTKAASTTSFHFQTHDNFTYRLLRKRSSRGSGAFPVPPPRPPVSKL